MSPESVGPATASEPLLRITGGATAEETAAIIAVISSLNVAAADPVRPRTWGAPSAGVRTTLTAGPGAWRDSALPR